MKLKIGQRVKYKEEYFKYSSDKDIELGINAYTILSVGEDGDGFINEDHNWLVIEGTVEPLNQAVHCKTKEEFKAVLEYIESLGIGAKWYNGDRPGYDIGQWDNNKKNTCLKISDLICLEYCDKEYYQRENYSIITAQEYLRDWKDNPLENKCDCDCHTQVEKNNKIFEFNGEKGVQITAGSPLAKALKDNTEAQKQLAELSELLKATILLREILGNLDYKFYFENVDILLEDKKFIIKGIEK